MGDVISLAYLFGSSPNCFWCQFCDDGLKLKQLSEAIANYTASLQDSKPRKSISVGDPLIAMATEDGVWYRAEVLSCDEDGVEVLYVDYGNTEILPVTNTLPIPQQFVSLRKQALTYQLCTKSADTVEVWPNEAFSKLEDLAQSSEFITATVVGVEGDRLLVSLESNTCPDFAEAIL